MINNRQNGRRRGRGGAQVRNGGGGGGPERGNRIDNRSRGNAAQLLEKYKNLARDAQMQGDRVMTEYYLQFADHYFRVLGESRQRFEDQNQNQQRRARDEFDGYDDGDEGESEADAAEAAPEERRERAPRPPQQQPQARPQQAPQQPQAPRLDYGVEGEEVRADEEDPRRGRRRRRRNGEEIAGEGAAPERIEVDRLPPAFSAEGDAPGAARANGRGRAQPAAAAGDEAQAAAEPAPVAAEGEEAPAKPVRRRTRRVKSEEETGDSTVAA